MNTSMIVGPCADFEHDIVELAEGSLAREIYGAPKVWSHIEIGFDGPTWRTIVHMGGLPVFTIKADAGDGGRAGVRSTPQRGPRQPQPGPRGKPGLADGHR